MHQFSYPYISSFIRQLTVFVRITVLCSLFLLAAPAFAADPDYTTNDSCTNVSTAKTELGDLTYPIDDYTSQTVRKYFSMTNVPCAGANCSYCDDESNNTVKFCYNTSYSGGNANYTCSAPNVHELTAGNEVIINGSWFQAAKTSNSVCVQVLASDYTGWITLGCKNNLSNSLPVPSNVPTFSACYVDGACGSHAASHSKSKFSVTSVVVECIQGTLSNLFFEHVPGCEKTLFSQFKKQMERIVWVALTLYVIFYGIRVVLGERPPASGEVFIFVIKMALVIYFSVGGGVEDFLYEHFIDVMNSLTKMMFDAGSIRYDANGQYFNRGLCSFSSSNYDEGYKLMALFDSIDCRLASYMFINPVTGEPQLFAMIIPAILTGRIIFAVFALIFAIYLLSVTVYVVHNFIISIILLNLIMYFAPLFVPMALFSQTKKFYDSWVRSLLFGSLQPIVLFGFVTLMLTVFDQVFYADCTFTSKPVTTSSIVTRNGQTTTVNKTSYYFVVDRAGASQTCKKSMGYSLSEILNFPEMLNGITQSGNELVSTYNNMGSFIDIKKEFVTAITFKDSTAIKSTGAIAKGMMILSLFAFLFYHFVEVVFSIAENLIGGPQARQLVSTTPMGIANKAGAMAKDAAYTVAGHFIKPEPKDNNDDDKAGGTNRSKPNDWYKPTADDIGKQMRVNASITEVNEAGESVAKSKLGDMKENAAKREENLDEKLENKKTDKILKKALSSHEKFDEAHRDKRAQKIQEVAGLSDNPDSATHVKHMMNINAAINKLARDANVENTSEAANRAVVGPDRDHVKAMQSLNKQLLERSELTSNRKLLDDYTNKFTQDKEQYEKDSATFTKESKQHNEDMQQFQQDKASLSLDMQLLEQDKQAGILPAEQLAERDAQLQSRTSQLNEREVTLTQTEAQLMERVHNLHERSGELDERSAKIDTWASELNERSKKFAESSKRKPETTTPLRDTPEGKAEFSNLDDIITARKDLNISAASLQAINTRGSYTRDDIIETRKKIIETRKSLNSSTNKLTNHKEQYEQVSADFTKERKQHNEDMQQFQQDKISLSLLKQDHEQDKQAGILPAEQLAERDAKLQNLTSLMNEHEVTLAQKEARLMERGHILREISGLLDEWSADIDRSTSKLDELSNKFEESLKDKPETTTPLRDTPEGKAEFSNVDDLIAASKEHNISAASLQVNSAEDLTKLASFLETDTTLKGLDINRGTFGVEGVDIGSSKDTADAFRSVTEAIGRNSTLTDVTISGHHITDKGMEGIAQMLQSNSNLRKLDLTHSSTSLTGLSTLSKAISENKSSLTHLTLNNLTVSDNAESTYGKMGDTGAKLLAQSLESNSSLKVLSVRYGDIKAEGMEAIAAAATKNSTLTHLDLGNNWGGDRAAAAFTETLKSNNSLEQLDLSRSNIYKEGANSLTESAARNNVTLNLEANPLDTNAPKAPSNPEGNKPTPAGYKRSTEVPATDKPKPTKPVKPKRKQ